MHLHAVEEVFEVLSGDIEVYIGNETRRMTTNQTIAIPAGVKHGFINIGTGVLHMRATLASPIFEASYPDTPNEISRRWVPE